MKPKLTVLSGAGMSEESGIATFRDQNGLWENHHIEDVASIDGWHRNPQLVLDFYNLRRSQLDQVSPNEGHLLIASLQKYFDVSVITQNVDDLHERAGSNKVVHLHGELKKACSSNNKSQIQEYIAPIKLGDQASDGSQLRPFIVWFGEEVPLFDLAVQIISTTDILLVIGTSLQVYPAASLMHYAPIFSKKYIIDPNCNSYSVPADFIKITNKASSGMVEFVSIITQDIV